MEANVKKTIQMRTFDRGRLGFGRSGCESQSRINHPTLFRRLEEIEYRFLHRRTVVTPIHVSRLNYE